MGKRTLRRELTESLINNTSAQFRRYATDHTGRNTVPIVPRSSPLAGSPSERPFDNDRHDMTAKPQTTAFSGDPADMVLLSTATGSPSLYMQAEQRDDFSSYGIGPLHVPPSTGQAHLTATRGTEYSSSPIMLDGFDSNTDFLDMVLTLQGGQTPTLLHAGLAVSWAENENPGMLTTGSSSDAGSNSYPSHLSHKVAKVQNLWSTSQRPTAETQLWHKIVSSLSDNIFSSPDLETPGESSNDIRLTSNTEICLTHDIKMQLRNIKRNLVRNECNCFKSDGQLRDTCDQHYFCANSNDIFEQGLYLYLDKYQPTYPILHVPTFNPRAVQALLLFTICMIGLAFVKTEEAVRFICHIYPALLDEVYKRIISTTPEFSNPAAALSELILAHHMLFLVVVTEGNICPTKSEMLYRYTLTAAQNLGLFSSDIAQISDALFSSVPKDHRRWSSWSRVESMKNLIIGLILYDCSLSGIFSMRPIISTNTLKIALPCDFDLYRARSAHDWIHLVDQGSSLAAPMMRLSCNEICLPDLPCQVHISCLYGLMSAILVRLTANYHRLIVDSDLVQEDKHRYVPWQIYTLDRRAAMTTQLVVQFIQLYDTILRNSNPNCVVIWHNLCLLLTADIRLLERAAGREGPEAMQTARNAIRLWAQTPAARRACLHAAQIFHTLSHWKPMDGTGFQPVRCLFHSALVLALYTLVSPAVKDVQDSDGFDLAKTDIDWKAVGEEGLTDAPQDGAPQLRTDNPPVNFIRCGGPIILCGKTYFTGARHARRLVLDFASLLDEVGRHWMAKYTRLLYMIHDTLMDVKMDGNMGQKLQHI